MDSTSRRGFLGGLASLATAGMVGTGTWAALSDTETVRPTGRARQDISVTRLTTAEYNNLTYQQAYIAQGRIGGVLLTSEHRIGPTLNTPSQTADRNWSNGEVRGFTLVHDPTTSQARYSNQGAGTLTYTPSDRGPYTDILIAAQSASSGTIQVQSLQLNGRPLNANAHL